MTRKAAAILSAAVVAAVLLVGYLILAGTDHDEAGGASAKPKPTASPIQPAPNGGDVTETVAPGKPGATVKAKITKAAQLDNGVKIRVLSTKVAKVKPHGPGELGGPAVVGRLQIENKSNRSINVDGVMVTLTYGRNQVAQPSTSDPSSPFRGRLKPGEARQGVYVFRVPRNSDSRVSFVVQYGAGSEVARFVS